ncbi:MAG: hypothetical protein AB1801_18145 [Chloroflexota bacterium]
MSGTSGNLSTWQITNAWSEILARVFEHIEVKFNVTPEWLVNPATNRRLKLDLLYPQLGLAIRFEGLQVKQRRQRLSLEEEAQQQVRASARVEVCRAHGIELVVIDVAAEHPHHVFREIDLGFSRAKQRTKNKAFIRQITQARTAAAALARRINSPGDLRLYADLWQDRQYRLAEPAPTSPPAGKIPAFAVGMEVEHTAFGPGVILAATPNNGDTLLTVDFVTAGQKTLAASLVAGKLHPR